MKTMIAQLTQELTAALNATGHNELELVDPDTQRMYVLIDSHTYQLAKDALRSQQGREAITQGIAQLESGHGRLLDESFQIMRDRLGFTQKQ